MKTNQEIFETFKTNLRAAVDAAKCNGIKISSKDTSCHCPVGCVPEIGALRPNGAMARRVNWIADLPSMCPTAFFDGFDSNLGDSRDPDRYKGEAGEPYFKLGREYQLEFP